MFKHERSIKHRRDIEIRAEGEGGLTTLVHWSPPWNVLSSPVDYLWTDEGRKEIYERFERGAFAEVLKRPDLDVICETDHSFRVASVFGRTAGSGSDGTLRLAEDDYGLRFEVDLPDTPEANTLLTSVRRRDVRGTSFVFSTKMAGVQYEEEGDKLVRVVRKVEELYSVGFVIFPAYESDKGIEERERPGDKEAGPLATEYLQLTERRRRLAEVRAKQELLTKC